MKKICLSTGLFWNMRNEVDINIFLTKIKEMKLPLYGLDLVAMPLTKDLKLNPENTEFVKKLKFKGLHSPKTLGNKEIIDNMHKIYKSIDADYINFHINWKEDIELALKKDWKVCIENITFLRHNYPFETVKAMLDKNPGLGFIFDVNHAMTYSMEEVEKYLTQLKDRIVAVHLGAGENEEKHIHVPLTEGSPEILKKMNIVKQLDCPFILESTTEREDKVNFIKEEFEFAQKWLG